MIFVDVKIDDWLKRYPELQVKETECPDCGEIIMALRPFISKDYVGLTSGPCTCGSVRARCESSVTRSVREHMSWDALLLVANGE